MKCVGLFAGIGGMELGLAAAGHEVKLLCEISSPAQAVLRERYPGIPIQADIRQLRFLPEVDVVTAGFPCQDLSQAGRGAGIGGRNSGLVNEIFRLVAAAKRKPKWLILENVPFMLSLDRGRAIQHVIESIEKLGYDWAYRVVDARAFGVPQRRRRVIILAGRGEHPRNALLGVDHGEYKPRTRWDSGRGFYWTEGNTGLGWAPREVPTLKSGSTVGIASPPAIWFPGRGSIEVPSISDAERLQGFDAGWTSVVDREFGARHRWKLVGNAVCVPMLEWVAFRLEATDKYDHGSDLNWDWGKRGWPLAAWGGGGKRHASSASEWPCFIPRDTINTFLRHRTRPLSYRATAGFLKRALASRLNFEEGFLDDVAAHAKRMRETVD